MFNDPSSNPLPLSLPQLLALARAAGRGLTWALPAVAREAAAWKSLAARIPDLPLRTAALSALRTKRGHTDGAGMFSILVPKRDRTLVRALVAVEIIWDYLDSVHETAPGEANGRQLHLALADALDPGRPVSDWYRHHPWQNDGGYLAALVETSRSACSQFAHFDLVRDALALEARHAQVLALNHLPDPDDRDAALRQWAASEFPDDHERAWYELSGAASASLLVHVLLALAADPDCTQADVAATYDAYWPWISLATTMLDSYVDTAQDQVHGHHSYVSHYPSRAAAIDRIGTTIARAASEALRLRHGRRHGVLIASMVAMYLTKDSAHTTANAATTRRLVRTGGSLTTLLIPALRIWRIRYRQRTA